MKTRPILIFMVFMAQLSFSQSIGGDTSRWVFDLCNGDGITEMYVSKDTVIDNSIYTKYDLFTTRIDPRNGDTLHRDVDPIYISNQNGLVLYQWTRRITDTLYNFNSEIGESWTIKDRTQDADYLITVLDTFMTDINGSLLFSMSYEIRMVDSGFLPSVDTVYEIIGNKYSFIIPYDKYNSRITVNNQGGSMRCFTNNTLGFVELDNSQFFSPFEFDCDRLTSTNNIEDIPQGRLRLYPNPVHDVLYIESDSQEEGRLYNQQGRQVRVYKKTGTLDMSTLESGIYFLKVGEQVRKVVKM